jgi:hypothetical protein
MTRHARKGMENAPGQLGAIIDTDDGSVIVNPCPKVPGLALPAFVVALPPFCAQGVSSGLASGVRLTMSAISAMPARKQLDFGKRMNTASLMLMSGAATFAPSGVARKASKGEGP